MTANELYVKGARVWIPDEEAIWRGAELLEDYTGQKTVRIQYEEGEESEIQVKDKTKLPHLRNPEILIGENDLTSLSYLNEPEVLYNLQVRFMEQNVIYTYCGIVLVAINPYADLPIYGNEIIQAYSGQDMGAMDPHIFAVAEEAYKKMSRFEQNQSIIVSGESGAGKTVSAKYAMRYFAMVGGSQAETQVEKKVLASNPIMEAIGNAKTTRNDNSSRFGKYIEISFNKKNEIIGAHMRTYLLEKSRVVYQATEERNYHIFYQMCASNDLPELKKFQLLTAEEFYYTAHGGDPIINGVDDAEDFGDTRDALTLLGINSKDQMMVFQIMAAVLHFGNVRITEAEGETSAIAQKDKHLNLMCQLLGIEESQMRMWLCNRKYTTVGEVITKPLTAEQASNAQDALAKHIYAKMFDWIVEKVNLSLHSTTKQHRFIGVLDIYGFETFEINSFEQFCINYANEKLQQIFNMHVFKLEQEEYVKEAIEWSFIDFYDNQPCIDLIESKLGILDLLDEECKMPKGSDQNWCQKLYDKHYNKAKHFDKPRMSNTAFIIHHFADKVTYQANGFLEKNRDTVLDDHINILRASEYELVAELFEDKPDPNEKKQRAGSHPTQPLRSNPKGGKSTKKTVGSQQEAKKTVGDQFRESLFKLMDTLNATTPHYIRCIKPNDVKEAFEFDPKRAVEQLRACGVLETIRISAAGYPSRWTYSEFFQRYRVLARSKDVIKTNPRKTCENILITLIQDPDKYRFGKTKIFFRAGQVAYLEKLRSDKLKYCGIMIQKHVKGWLQRKRYRKVTKSITLIQKYGRGLLARRHAKFLRETWAAKTIQKRWKGYKARRQFFTVRKAVVILQASIRGFFGRREFQKALHTHRAIVIQRFVRGWLARVRYRRVIRGIVKLQSHYRRRKARTQLRILKIEAKSVDHIKNVNKGLENKIIQLQQQLDVKNKEIITVKQQEGEIEKMKVELEKLRGSSGEAEKYSNKITDLLEEIKSLKLELEREQIEKQDLIAEKELMKKDKADVANKLTEENNKLSAELEEAKSKLEAQEKDLGEIIKSKVEAATKQLQSEFDSERGHHQRLVKEHARLQQRLENLQGEVEYLTSPGGHKRTPSDISAISLESFTSSVSPDEKKEEVDDEHEKEDQGYGTEKSKKKKKAPAPPQPSAAVNGDKEIDVGLLLKLQNRVKDLEKEKEEMRRQLDEEKSHVDEEKPAPSGEVIPDSAFNALKQRLVNADDVQLVIKLQKKVKDLELTKTRLRSELEDREEDEENNRFNITTPEYAYNNLKMQELENENDKLKREVAKLMKAISDSTDFDQGKELSPAGKEFMGQFDAMNDELERRREECLQLRAMMAEKSITTHAIAKESYGGNDNIVNEDNELSMAYRTQKELNSIDHISCKTISSFDTIKKRNAWKNPGYVAGEEEVDKDSTDQPSKMGAAESAYGNHGNLSDDEDKSQVPYYSVRNSASWNNIQRAPQSGKMSSAQYLDLVNETSGFWTFDDSVNTRVSHVMSEEQHDLETSLGQGHDLSNYISLDSGLQLDTSNDEAEEKECERSKMKVEVKPDLTLSCDSIEAKLSENLSLIRKSSSASSLLGLVNMAADDLDTESEEGLEARNDTEDGQKECEESKTDEDTEVGQMENTVNEERLEARSGTKDSQTVCKESVTDTIEDMAMVDSYNRPAEPVGCMAGGIDPLQNKEEEPVIPADTAGKIANVSGLDNVLELKSADVENKESINPGTTDSKSCDHEKGDNKSCDDMISCDLIKVDTESHDPDTMEIQMPLTDSCCSDKEFCYVKCDKSIENDLETKSQTNGTVKPLFVNYNHGYCDCLINQNQTREINPDCQNPTREIKPDCHNQTREINPDCHNQTGEINPDFHNQTREINPDCHNQTREINHVCHRNCKVVQSLFPGGVNIDQCLQNLEENLNQLCSVTNHDCDKSDYENGESSSTDHDHDCCSSMDKNRTPSLEFSSADLACVGVTEEKSEMVCMDCGHKNHVTEPLDNDQCFQCRANQTSDTNHELVTPHDSVHVNSSVLTNSTVTMLQHDLDTGQLPVPDASGRISGDPRSRENPKSNMEENLWNLLIEKKSSSGDSVLFNSHDIVSTMETNFSDPVLENDNSKGGNSNQETTKGDNLCLETSKGNNLCSIDSNFNNNEIKLCHFITEGKGILSVIPEISDCSSIEGETHMVESDGAYLTCSDNESADNSSLRYSQPESGFCGTQSSDFYKHGDDLSLAGSFDGCCHGDVFDGSICGCPECLGQLRIERIVTADKSTMCPDEPPYVLMCEICEELLENQLQKTEKDSKKKEQDLKKQLKNLKDENEKQAKVIQENLQLGPEAKIEATMQHEITRLTSENLDLRESQDKYQDQIRKLKKMLKTYAKRLKDGEAAEIAAEIDKEDTQSVGNVASVKHTRERNYMGMLEYRKEDEQALVKNVIMDLKPHIAVGLLPGLPAYVLFMCVRHTDYVNDDEKVRSLLTNTINGIKKCVKKHHGDLERVTLWLANTCRLLHTLKQYSGEKAFQSDNTPRQNEHCLRNFDLSEYRQVFSDLAVWIYQTLIKQMQEAIQQTIVPAVLEHEAIAGLTASKPSGMRGRASSIAGELEDKELSLDSLMKSMNKYSHILAQHAVDPELVKQIFRQLYYFIGAGALNNLLLRKDMCNWSKGMQIRYNLSHFEQWLRDNKLQESGAISALEPITQASQLLQARKTDADVDSICEMCSKLTTPQIVKILNLYTPVDEFEERVPISFIRKIQKKLQDRQGSENTLLMDTKFTFPVTFPFNPSSIALETIDVPEQLHLGFLIRH